MHFLHQPAGDETGPHGIDQLPFDGLETIAGRLGGPATLVMRVPSPVFDRVIEGYALASPPAGSPAQLVVQLGNGLIALVRGDLYVVARDMHGQLRDLTAEEVDAIQLSVKHDAPIPLELRVVAPSDTGA